MFPLIVIPVRGGSKGIPKKNLQPVAGVSLVGRAVRAAKEACRLLGGGRVVVDSDADDLLAEARRWGAETPYVRPAHLASDTAGSMDVLRHALTVLGITAGDATPIVLVQATSPLVTGRHIADAVLAYDQDPVVSVCPAEHHPAWSFRQVGGVIHALVPDLAATRRQDLPPAFRLTGAVYVGSAADVHAGKHFVQPGRTRAVLLDAAHAVDVDHPSDLQVAEALATPVVTPFRLGGRLIGPGHPAYIIAEAGVNHDGDLAEAHRLVDAAADAGADAVKFQTWRTELLVKPGAATAAYQQDATGAVDQYTMLKALELPEAWHAELRDHAAARGIHFMSTPDEIVSARFLATLGVPAMKVGSAELDNLPFLAQIADLCRGHSMPLLLSTGMGDLTEVLTAVDTLRNILTANGGPGLALFHCVSQYPAPLDEMNVRAIATLRRATGLPVGLSDHYPGPEAALAAVGVGMDIWEKHLTCDVNRPGPDHRMSLEPAELKRQIDLVRKAERALGDGHKVPRASEAGTKLVVRKRLCAARAIAAGQVITAEDLTGLRTETGLPVSAWAEVVGRTAARAIDHLDPITPETLA